VQWEAARDESRRLFFVRIQAIDQQSGEGIEIDTLIDDCEFQSSPRSMDDLVKLVADSVERGTPSPSTVVRSRRYCVYFDRRRDPEILSCREIVAVLDTNGETVEFITCAYDNVGHADVVHIGQAVGWRHPSGSDHVADARSAVVHVDPTAPKSLVQWDDENGEEPKTKRFQRAHGRPLRFKRLVLTAPDGSPIIRLLPLSKPLDGCDIWVANGRVVWR